MNLMKIIPRGLIKYLVGPKLTTFMVVKWLD
jgi:hypothetical protein